MHKFIFKSYHYSQNNSDLSVKYFFVIEHDKLVHQFEHRLEFKDIFLENTASTENLAQIEPYIANLGLAEALSYWKLTAAPLFEVQALSLEHKQIDFWHKLLIKGMGEYFYINQIKFNAPDFVNIYSSNNTATTLSKIAKPNINQTKKSSSKKIMVPVGGGKDSIVTIELVKSFGLEPQFYMLNPIASAMATIEKSGFTEEKNQSIVKRIFDPLLFDLNKQGYLNGHVPISATIAFSSILTAKLKDIDLVAISNERSSNEGNVFYCDQEINHQYSKTYEFESDFRNYVTQYIDQNSPSYFSMLRPLFEIQIAKIFANHTQYHQVFRSCNRGQKTNSWCGECPKCMFAYIILSPFLSNDRLNEIFGKNLFAHLELYPLIEELTGISPNKPFECVGTREETLIALYLATENMTDIQLKKLPLLEQVKRQILDKENNLKDRAQKILNDWNDDNFLPEDFAANLKSTKKKSVLIFGFGREGQASLEFIKANPTMYDTNKIYIYDDSQLDLNIKNVIKISQDQIDELPNELLIIKTAGVKPTHEFLQKLQVTKKISLTTNTNLFFETLKKKFPSVITIGITGTKGKSTTSSLIYHVLKENNLNVFFGGNIGKPPTEILKEIATTNGKIIVVLELSCHQLSDIHYSPDIAVLQDISPEHLDYYETFEQYRDAKINITKFQNSQNWLITSPEYSHYSISSKASPAQKINFDLDTLKNKDVVDINLSKIKLVGKHNLYNLIPSILIAKKFAIANNKIQQALESFKPLPHRLELVANRDGVLYINDSLSTTPKATIAAIESFADKNLILILGGHDRHLEFDELAEVILKHKVKLILYFNPTGTQIVEALNKKDIDKKMPPNQLVTSMQEAVELAKAEAKSGDVVLMSPASASFGIFKDYEDRGEQFKNSVFDNQDSL